jgi:hypothetical protein
MRNEKWIILKVPNVTFDQLHRIHEFCESSASHLPFAEHIGFGKQRTTTPCVQVFHSKKEEGHSTYLMEIRVLVTADCDIYVSDADKKTYHPPQNHGSDRFSIGHFEVAVPPRILLKVLEILGLTEEKELLTPVQPQIA